MILAYTKEKKRVKVAFKKHQPLPETKDSYTITTAQMMHVKL